MAMRHRNPWDDLAHAHQRIPAVTYRRRRLTLAIIMAVMGTIFAAAHDGHINHPSGVDTPAVSADPFTEVHHG